VRKGLNRGRRRRPKKSRHRRRTFSEPLPETESFDLWTRFFRRKGWNWTPV